MRGVLVLVLLSLIVGSLFVHLIKTDQGYILIHYGTSTLQMTFWFGVLAFLALLCIALMLVKIIKSSLKGVVGSISFVSQSRHKKAEQRTHSGLIHFIEGNWRAAKKDLLSAAKSVDKPLVHYLAAARSAYEMGDSDETLSLLHQAEQAAPKNELAIALSQARIQLLDKKYEQCLATLERARKHVRDHPVVLDLLKQVYFQLNDWNALCELLPELKRSKQYSEEELSQLEVRVYRSLILDQARQLNQQEPQFEALDKVWQSIPKKLKQHSELVSVYSELLFKSGFSIQAEPLLRKAIKDSWDNDLVNLYGRLDIEPAREQLVVAEKWLRERPGDAQLLLALGRISMRNELWGKAKDYYTSSLQLLDLPETNAELGALLAQLGEHKESVKHYQRGLLLATS